MWNYVLQIQHKTSLKEEAKQITGIYDIPVVDEYKYLGITLNHKLKPLPHLEKIQENIEKYKRM